MKTKTPLTANSMNVSPVRRTFLLIPLLLACLALLPQARAVCQEGCDGGLASTFLGDDALSHNTGFGNTAIGDAALIGNTTGFSNTATGAFTLSNNTTGNNNAATGQSALSFNTTGSQNTATGRSALLFNVGGSNNTATGHQALFRNRVGKFNIALGANAGYRTNGDNNIDIGNQGVPDESNTIRIGTVETHDASESAMHTATFIAGISGATVPTGIGVIVDSTGHLGTTTSSARYKENIQPMDNASEVILALKPVTFRYKHELDREGIPQFGLVAEDVEKVNPDLVARDGDGKAYTVRYEAVNAMLLNEFLKEHRTVQEQKATIAQLKSALAKQETVDAEQQKQIETLTASVQKMSNQPKLMNAGTRMVANNQ